MKSSVFEFPSWTNHLHRVASSLNRSGWLVWRLCKASLMFFWHGLRFPTIRIIVKNRENASLFSRRAQFGFFFSPFLSGFYAVNFMMYFTVPLAWCFLVLLCVVSSSVCLEPSYVNTNIHIHMYPSGGFLSSSASCVTPNQGSDSDLSPSMFQSSSMVASQSTSRLILACF